MVRVFGWDDVCVLGRGYCFVGGLCWVGGLFVIELGFCLVVSVVN